MPDVSPEAEDGSALRLPFRCECGNLFLIFLPRRRWAEIVGDIESPEYLAELAPPVRPSCSIEQP